MPTVNFTLQDIAEPELLSPTVGWPVELGIVPYGLGLFFTAPLALGIAANSSAPVELGILEPAIDDPLVPVGIHIGAGTIVFSFDHPHPELVDYYELFAAATLAGPYQKYQAGEFEAKRGLVRNVPVSAIVAYFQLRAVGRNGAVSNLVPVKQGKRLTNQLLNLKIRGIAGSVIPAGARFGVQDMETGGMLLVQAAQEIVI